MTEYLVRDGLGRWEICRPGVFSLREEHYPEKKFVVAWATRDGAFFCTNEDVLEVRELED